MILVNKTFIKTFLVIYGAEQKTSPCDSNANSNLKSQDILVT